MDFSAVLPSRFLTNLLRRTFPKLEVDMSDTGGVAADQLRAFVERIERLEEEKKVISDDIKDVYAEAKGNGYEVKILRTVVSLRKKLPHEREEEEAVLDLYMHALGMLVPDTDPGAGPATTGDTG
jgi:uncharacterized protein (UPF0335 family)